VGGAAVVEVVVEEYVEGEPFVQAFALDLACEAEVGGQVEEDVEAGVGCAGGDVPGEEAVDDDDG
jgi:hypothetical protein